jgi:hypothetical protein
MYPMGLIAFEKLSGKGSSRLLTPELIKGRCHVILTFPNKKQRICGFSRLVVAASISLFQKNQWQTISAFGLQRLIRY